MFEFDPHHFGFMRDVLTIRYGAPHKQESVAVRTKAGVEYENEVVRWDGVERYIRLERYGASADKGSLTFGSVVLDRQEITQREQAKRSAAALF